MYYARVHVCVCVRACMRACVCVCDLKCEMLFLTLLTLHWLGKTHYFLFLLLSGDCETVKS